MTDTAETLLRKAAMAAGYTPDGKFGRGLLVVRNAGTQDMEAFAFDPINNSGDALDLAVDLLLAVDCGDTVSHVYKNDPGVEELRGSDPYAATRLAITRAAAAIYDSQHGAAA